MRLEFCVELWRKMIVNKFWLSGSKLRVSYGQTLSQQEVHQIKSTRNGGCGQIVVHKAMIFQELGMIFVNNALQFEIKYHLFNVLQVLKLYVTFENLKGVYSRNIE